ncbi:hypothetical protein JTB14_030637 [Gonioctena quinquepunctata]|nr:hypothetical protein JTB14_030637 [Gonioctena quinquepunctata]
MSSLNTLGDSESTSSESRALEVVESSDEDLENESKSKYEDADSNIIERISSKLNKIFQRNSKEELNESLKFKVWNSVVTIVIVEGKDLLPLDSDIKTLDPYCVFRLGDEMNRSRVVWKSLNPRWLQQIDLHLFDDSNQQLEVTLWDKENRTEGHLGRCLIDLAAYERERTHTIHKKLEDGNGSLHLLLTISGIAASEATKSSVDNPVENEAIAARYVYRNTFVNIQDVGHLVVKLFRAQGLAATNWIGESDTFCVVELGNARVRTQTIYNSLDPSWDKVFSFGVKDISDVLEVTVFDVDQDEKVEFLGKVVVPLLGIKNGEMKWYALKNKKLRGPAKGSAPKILLELTLYWNPIRACIKTLNPKEEKYMLEEPKFKMQVFIHNVLRLKIVITYFYECGKLVRDCLESKSKLHNISGLLVWLAICYVFQPWMFPAVGLVVMIKEYITMKSVQNKMIVNVEDTCGQNDGKDCKEKRNLKNKLRTIQDVPQDVPKCNWGYSVVSRKIPKLVQLHSAVSFIHYDDPVSLWYFRSIFSTFEVLPHACWYGVPDDEILLDYEELLGTLDIETEIEKVYRKPEREATWQSYLEEQA